MKLFAFILAAAVAPTPVCINPNAAHFTTMVSAGPGQSWYVMKGGRQIEPGYADLRDCEPVAIKKRGQCCLLEKKDK